MTLVPPPQLVVTRLVCTKRLWDFASCLVFELPGGKAAFVESIAQAVLALLLDFATVYWAHALGEQTCDAVETHDPRKQLFMYPLCMFSSTMLLATQALVYANSALLVCIHVIMFNATQNKHK